MPAEIDPLLMRLAINPPGLLLKALVLVTEIVPLLVMVPLVILLVPTAFFIPSIVTPELIVTLASPLIAKIVQLSVIITVVPETSVQGSAANA